MNIILGVELRTNMKMKNQRQLCDTVTWIDEEASEGFA